MASQLYPPSREEPILRRTELGTFELSHGSKAASTGVLPEPETTPETRINKISLFDLCDDVRTSLQEDACLGPRGGTLMRLLGDIVKSEYDGTPILDHKRIRATRFDKMITDLLDKSRYPQQMSADLRACLSIAESLQRHWRARLRDSYLGMDNYRYLELTQKDGRLENVYLDEEKFEGDCLWAAKGEEGLSELAGNSEIKEGHWWLNLACAQRDGIVCSTSDSVSKGKYGITTLPLLTGTEIAQWPEATVEYIREGTLRDMCVSLISQVGTRIRILRGHRLRSPFAPKVGVRYDGQYIIRRYGQSRNPLTGVFRLSLDLERVEGQQPMHIICRAPRPSEVDDWHLFEKLESDILQKKWDDAKYLEWKREKAQQRADQEEFRKRLHLESMKFIQVIKDDEQPDLENMAELKSIRKLIDLVWER